MIPGWDYDVIKQVPFSKRKGFADTNLYVVNTMQEWEAFYSLLQEKEVVACDTETTGFEYYNDDRIVGMSFGWHKDHFYVPVRHVDSFTGGKQPPQLSMDSIRPALQEFFARQDLFVIGHNWKFDRHFYMADGIETLSPYHDTTILWHLFDENAPKALKQIASGWTDLMKQRHPGLFGPEAAKAEKELSQWRSDEAKARRDHLRTLIMKKADELQLSIAHQDKNRTKLKQWIAANVLNNHPFKDAKKDQIHYGYVPIELMTRYAGIDTFLTHHLYEEMMKELTLTTDLVEVYTNEIQLSNVLFHSEESGALIDTEYLEVLDEELTEQCSLVHRRIQDQLGTPINMNSNPQIVSAFTNLGATLTKQTPSGAFSMDGDVLKELAKTYPVANDMLFFRGTEKILSTYVHGIQRSTRLSPYVHMSFNPNVTTGRMSCSDPNCFDGSTEVLTPEGWVRFDSYKDQQVAQWSEDGSLSFVKPTSYYKGKSSLLHIQTRDIDLCVTPNHRCLLRNRKTGKLKVVEASDYPEDYQQIKVGELDGSRVLSDAQISLACAIQADSHLTPYNKYDFKLSKERKIARLRSCLDTLGIPYREKKWAKGYRFHLDKNDTTECLGGKLFSFDKLISLSLECKRFFADEVMFWDGCYARLSMYASKEKSNADAVQAVLSSVGIRARLRKYVNQRGSVSWQVDRVNKSYSLTTNRKVETLPEGNVYCVSVPSSYLMVRRGQNVLVTGNCQNIPRGDDRIRRAFICPHGFYYVFADYSQVEVRLTAHYSEDPIMLDAYEKGQDIHTRTAGEMFDISYEQLIAVLGNEDHENYKEFSNFRSTAKTINFGIIYGVGAPGLSHQIPRPKRYADLSEKAWIAVCQKYIDRYYEKYRYVKRFINKCRREIRTKAEITNYFGRVRHLPTVNARHILGEEFNWMSGKAERQAANFVIQSTAADVFKFATVRVAEEVFKGSNSHIVNLVHDEIQSYISKDELHLLNKKRDIMEDFDFIVPLKVDFAYSTTSWANKKALVA